MEPCFSPAQVTFMRPVPSPREPRGVSAIWDNVGLHVGKTRLVSLLISCSPRRPGLFARIGLSSLEVLLHSLGSKAYSSAHKLFNCFDGDAPSKSFHQCSRDHTIDSIFLSHSCIHSRERGEASTPLVSMSSFEWCVGRTRRYLMN